MEEVLNTLVDILENKIQEGLEELPKLSPKTEDYTVCLNNLLTSIELKNKIVFKPVQPKKEELETKTVS